MLQANKRVLLANVKSDALELRNKELEFNVERYTNLATQASVMAGFSFESLVELEVPEHTNEWLSSIYFVFASLAMSLSLYVLCIASFASIYGHRLALQGPHGSLERSVSLMVSYRSSIFNTAGVALMNLVGAAICMSWIKMGPAAGAVTTVFLAFTCFLFIGMGRMAKVFEIPEEDIVTGATFVRNQNAGGAAIDLALLDPSAPDKKSASPRTPSTIAGSDRPGSSSSSTRRPVEGGQPSSDASATTLHHEGYLFKKAGNSKISQASRSFNLDASRRRYFVLRGTKLYYFKSWEEYGAGGIERAVNKSNPIDMYSYLPTIASDAIDDTRFDLVPQSNDPNARKWELQAGSQAEAIDWLSALREAYQVKPW